MKLVKLHRCATAAKALALLATLAALAALHGCTRRHYRDSADYEVLDLLREKDKYPAWKIEAFHVYPDARARFADPTNPDRPPMPPDDPAAEALSPQPQKPGHAGVARIEGTGWLQLLCTWNAENRAAPGVAQAKHDPATPQPFLIKLEQAAELGLINSREFQSRRENLYLGALPVTLERFAFTPQFFAFEEAIRERAARDSRVGYQNRWTFATEAGFTKLFSTGALLLARFANETVVNLTGAGPHTVSASDVSLDLVQPFLRGGGRAVTLEALTQSERNLVYDIRDYARFRKQFYTGIAGGIDFSLAAAFTGRLGGGLTPGLSATGAIDVRPIVNAGGAGRLDLGTTDIAPAEGYLPNLVRSAAVVNEQKNVKALEELVKLYVEFERGGRVSPLQVDQVRLQLLRSRNEVLRREVDLRDGLDRFKLQLGIPANTLIDLDPTAIKPLLTHLDKIEDVFADTAASLEELKKYGGIDDAAQFRARLRKYFTETRVVEGTPFRVQFNARWDEWSPAKLTDDALGGRLKQDRAERKRLSEQKETVENRGGQLTPAQLARLDELDYRIAAGALEQILREYERQPWRHVPGPAYFREAAGLLLGAGAPPGAGPAPVAALAAQAADPRATDAVRLEMDRRKRAKHADQFQQVQDAVELVLIEARNQRFDPLRGKNWPDLAPLDLAGLNLLRLDLDQAQGAVTQTALGNRLDLMNARAEVVDAWRQLRIFANSLLGTFDVAYHFDSRTPPGQARPLAFSGSRNRHQLFFNLELPLVRKAERNNYRASLIAYQRQRRNLMAAEDAVATQVRTELRQLRLLEESYKIQRETAELAYRQVENALEAINRPPDPGQLSLTRDTGAEAAALTQQLLQAQASLLQVQNQLITIWINYQIVRLQLYLDMELMPLDSRGVWIDELATRRNSPPNDGPAGPGYPGGGAPAQRGGPEALPPPGQLPAPQAGPPE